MTNKSRGINWSKNRPRPTPIGYKVDQNRKQWPYHLFDKNRKPITKAMEAYRNRNYRYPKGVTPIYENNMEKGEESNDRQ